MDQSKVQWTILYYMQGKERVNEVFSELMVIVIVAEVMLKSGQRMNMEFENIPSFSGCRLGHSTRAILVK